MPQDRPVPGSAEDWLARAEGDLVLARVPLPEGAFYEDLCFHAHRLLRRPSRPCINTTTDVFVTPMIWTS